MLFCVQECKRPDNLAAFRLTALMFGNASWQILRNSDVPFPGNASFNHVDGDHGEKMAEREGFEPSMDHRPIPVFEPGPFNRSGPSPKNRGTPNPPPPSVQAVTVPLPVCVVKRALTPP